VCGAGLLWEGRGQGSSSEPVNRVCVGGGLGWWEVAWWSVRLGVSTRDDADDGPPRAAAAAGPLRPFVAVFENGHNTPQQHHHTIQDSRKAVRGVWDPPPVEVDGEASQARPPLRRRREEAVSFRPSTTTLARAQQRRRGGDRAMQAARESSTSQITRTPTPQKFSQSIARQLNYIVRRQEESKWEVRTAACFRLVLLTEAGGAVGSLEQRS
jgi:hypothetical protein